MKGTIEVTVKHNQQKHQLELLVSHLFLAENGFLKSKLTGHVFYMSVRPDS